MSLSNGKLLGILAGALWGALGIIIATVILTLVSGAPAEPKILVGAVSGALGTLAYLIGRVDKRDLSNRFACWTAVFLCPLITTYFTPFGISVSQATLLQGIVLLLFGFGVTFAIIATLKNIKPGKLTRYEREVIYVRMLKGLGFITFTAFVAFPFYIMVVTSFKSQQALRINPLDLSIDVFQPTEQLFRSYIELFTKFNFGDYLINSAYVSVATVLLTLLFSIPGAYAVARLRFPGRAVLSRSILLIYMVPAIVLVIPLYAVFSQAGLRDSLTGLLIIYPATTIPVALYMLQGYFRGLPHELEEAGLVDGLSRIGVILKITMPLSLPAIASVSLYVFMIAWNEFLFAFMFLDNPEIFTLSRGVVSLNSSEVPRQHLMAGAVVATIPVLVLFLWFERFLVQGLTAGSVKG